MKLVDLNPVWVSWGDPSAAHQKGVGVNFDCPRCRGEDQKHRIGVLFANPLQGGIPVPGNIRYQRTGETFETLTLSPSILVFDIAAGEKIEHWHGWVKDGTVTPALALIEGGAG